MTTELGLVTSLKTKVQAATWPSTSNVVWPANAVAVVGSIAESLPQFLETKRVPFCLIAVADSESDPEHDEEPDFLKTMIDVAIGTMIGGDAIGEFVMTGGPLSGGASQSQGQGLLTLEQQLYNVIGKLNQLEGIVLQNRQKVGQGAVYDKTRATWIAWRVIRHEAWVTMV